MTTLSPPPKHLLALPTNNIDTAITEQHRTNLYLTVDGSGLAQAKVHCKGQNWIRGATNLLSPSNFINAAKLRTNRLPNKEVMLRGRDGDKSCRHCHRFVETNNHIMQKCPITHHLRFARHDSLMDYIRQLAEDQNHIVIPEWHIATRDGTRKPDLIIITPSVAIVCDVTVTSDTEYSLDNARIDKIAKYSTPDVNSEITRHYPDRDIVLPTVRYDCAWSLPQWK